MTPAHKEGRRWEMEVDWKGPKAEKLGPLLTERTLQDGSGINKSWFEGSRGGGGGGGGEGRILVF